MVSFEAEFSENVASKTSAWLVNVPVLVADVNVPRFAVTVAALKVPAQAKTVNRTAAKHGLLPNFIHLLQIESFITAVHRVLRRSEENGLEAGSFASPVEEKFVDRKLPGTKNQNEEGREKKSVCVVRIKFPRIGKNGKERGTACCQISD